MGIENDITKIKDDVEVLDSQIIEIREQMDRIESKLDKLSAEKAPKDRSSKEIPTKEALKLNDKDKVLFECLHCGSTAGTIHNACTNCGELAESGVKEVD